MKRSDSTNNNSKYMLKTGKPLKVYEIQQKDLKKFAQEAKRYGVLYYVLKDKSGENTTVDVISRVEDASKIQRITERFKLTAIDTNDVIGSIEKERMFPTQGIRPRQEEKTAANPTQARASKRPSVRAKLEANRPIKYVDPGQWYI